MGTLGLRDAVAMALGGMIGAGRGGRRMYEEAITTLLEDRVILPAFTLANSFGVKRRVRGFEPHPSAQYNPRLVGAESGPVRLRE